MTPTFRKTLYYIILYYIIFTPPSYLYTWQSIILYYIIEGNRSAKRKVLRVETYVLGGARRVASQPFAKITIDPEPCMTMLLEKLRKSDRSSQHTFKDEPWLMWVSGETRWGARNSQAYRSNVNSAHISTYTEATQTLLTWEL